MPAFDLLLERNEDWVYGYSLKFLGDSALAEEATQETFVTLWRLRHGYDARGLFKAYLGRINLNVCRGLLRSKRRRRQAMQRFAQQQPRSSPGELEEWLLRREREREVLLAISKLSRRLREAVLLRFYGGLSYQEMAPVLGRSAMALRSRVHKAVHLLRELLPEEGR